MLRAGAGEILAARPLVPCGKSSPRKSAADCRVIYGGLDLDWTGPLLSNIANGAYSACKYKNLVSFELLERNMSEILVNLIIQAVGGAIGGNAIGATLKNLNLGTLGNTIAGALGGAGGGSILSALIPALSGGAGGLDIGALAGQLVGGGATGAIVTAIVGAVVNGMKNKA
jgi:hypothetical protein